MMHRKWPVHVLWMILSIIGLCAAGCAQDTEQDLKKEIEELRQGQQMIRKELQEIKALIRASQPARPTAPDVRNVEFDLGDNPVLGTNTASLTLVEFTDYQ
jgi:protein-disulfide isomerase